MKNKPIKEIVARKATPAAKNPAKAGVMLYEDLPEGRKLLVSFNEGRFSKNGEYYVLPKGGVDEGESPLHGGIRELGEETGFDLHSFLGHDNLAKLEKGKTLRNITNPAWPGVTVVEFNPQGVAHEYHARTGVKQSMVMYGVNIKGIDKLGPLKNRDNRSTKELLDADRTIPRFPTFFSWMQAGTIPAENPAEQIQICDPAWFAGMIAAHAPNGKIRQRGNWEETRADWKEFCVAIEADKPAFKQLRGCFEIIKTHLKKTGAVGGDKAILKFDDKDCPLFWYVEGGHVGFAKDILTETFRDIRGNSDYGRAFGGHGTNEKGLMPQEIMLHGQVAAYGPFVRPSDLRTALNAAWGETGKAAQTMIEYGSRCRMVAASAGR